MPDFGVQLVTVDEMNEVLDNVKYLHGDSGDIVLAGSANLTLQGNFRAENGTFRIHRHPYGNERHIESGAIPSGGGSISFTNAFALAPAVAVGSGSGSGVAQVTAVSTTGATFAGVTWATYTASGYWIAEGVD